MSGSAGLSSIVEDENPLFQGHKSRGVCTLGFAEAIFYSGFGTPCEIVCFREFFGNPDPGRGIMLLNEARIPRKRHKESSHPINNSASVDAHSKLSAINTVLRIGRLARSCRQDPGDSERRLHPRSPVRQFATVFNSPRTRWHSPDVHPPGVELLRVFAPA